MIANLAQVRQVYWILLVALCLRLPVLFITFDQAQYPLAEQRAMQGGDSVEYVNLAANLVEKGIYSHLPAEPYTPNANRPPLFPLLLAGLYIVAGQQHSAPLIVAVQIAFSLVSIGLAMAIARQVLGERVAQLTGWLYAVAGISIAITGLILTETIFTTIFLAAIYATIRYAQAATWRWALAIGILFALATYMRPIALYAIFIPSVALIIMRWRDRQRWLQVGAMLLVCGVLLLPWYARNWATFGKLSFSSVGDFNLLIYNAASVYAYQEGVSIREAKDAVGVLFGERLAPSLETKPVQNEMEVVAVMRETALDILLANPLQTAWVHLVDALNVFRPGYSSLDLMLSNTPTAIGDNTQSVDVGALTNAPPEKLLLYGLLTVQTLATYGLALIGILILVWRRNGLGLWLFLVLPLWFVITPSIAGNARFRVPIEGILALLAALGGWTVYHSWYKWRSTGGERMSNVGDS